MNRSTHPELFDLMGAACDGVLDEAGAVRLNTLLKGDDAAQQTYAEYMLLHNGLSWECSNKNAVAFEKLFRSAPSRSVVGWISPTRLLAAAVILLVVTFGLWRSMLLPDASLMPEPIHGVAVITHVANAQWNAKGLAVEPGTPMPAGKLILDRGLAQIEFYSGATVILEGPAELDLVDANRAFCHRGRIRSHVPPQAQGFTIGAPGADVVDLGTEFGLRVDPESGTEVHVFDGKVEVHEKASPGKTELGTGNAVRIQGAERSDIALDTSAFVGPERMADLAGVGQLLKYDRWQAHRDKLVRDADLLLYYDFDRAGAWGRTLKNGAVAQWGAPDGAAVGCRWVPGRWAEKRALEFKRPSDRVLINVPGEYDSFSMATWVRFDGFDYQFNAIMHTDGWDHGDVHTHIESPGKINIDLNRRERLSSNTYLGPEDLGRWIHLAWVYDTTAGRVTFYLDGHEDASMPIVSKGKVRFGSAQIGNWDKTHRNLNGQMDEFLIMGRAMSADEVRAMVEVGRPY